MGKYFCLQWKRIARLLPAALCVAAILFGALSGLFAMVTQLNTDSEDKVPVRIGLVGDTSHSFFQLGLQALEAFDSTRFAIKLETIDAQDQAESALKTGQLSAYVVIPDQFMEEAVYGNFLLLDFVSSSGATTVVSMVKEDFTGVISDILSPAQRGIYGIRRILRNNELTHLTSGLVDRLALRFVEHALLRSNAYRVEQVGIGNGLSFENYLLCGLSVTLLTLMCLTFAPVMICRDHSLSRLLHSKGRAVFSQTAAEFAAYLAVLLILLAAVFAALSAFSGSMGFALPKRLGLFAYLPVVLMVAALSYLLYTLSGDLISGVLLQFFVMAAMDFVSGCIYPVFFFPETIQRLAAWLPTGMARAHLAAYITGDSPLHTGLLLLLYSAVFFFGAESVRSIKLRRLGR